MWTRQSRSKHRRGYSDCLKTGHERHSKMTNTNGTARCTGKGEVAGADEAARISAIGDAVTKEPEAPRSEGRVDEVLKQDVCCVLGLNDTRLKHSEAGLHEKHQGTCTSADPAPAPRVSAHAGPYLKVRDAGQHVRRARVLHAQA